FEAPTIAAFTAQIGAHAAESDVPLRPVARDEGALPLSFAQQRLWFLDQLQPGGTLHSIPCVVRLRGRLDHAALERSLGAIVERHEVLRTSFGYDAVAAQPFQQIAPPSPVALPVLPLAEDVGDDTVPAVIAEIVRQPFDLQRGPLWRAALFRHDPRDHILVLVIHHSVFDGWSQGVLLRELGELYPGFVQDQPVTLPALPIQYADFAHWQRAWLQGDVLDQQLSYWRAQLADVASLDLPTDYQRPAMSSDRGAHTSFQIPAVLASALHRLSQDLDSTLFMTLLAAWQTLLARYSGQTDIPVGTPIAGRVRPELETLIGFFVNTLVLRTDLSGQPSFAEVVERVRRVCLGAFAHQDLPFEMLVEHVQPTRDLSRSPLFQVMFALQNLPRRAIELPELIFEPIGTERHTSQFDLSLTLSESPDGLRGQLGYRTDLFEAATIERLIGHYAVLLAAVVADPRQPIVTLPLLTEAERRHLLIDWNSMALPYPEDQCLHHLVEAQAARTPEAAALVCGDAALTYAELNARANQLAHHLRDLGVGPETRVGLYVERSPELVVGVLGILKAGGAYVPLDPGYPHERLAFMAQDARLGVLVTQATLSATLPAYAGIMVRLDADAATIAGQPQTNPQTDVRPDHLAYVIYTSGSTGRPKGVLVEHRQVVNTLWGNQRTFGFAPTDVLPWLASVAFDIAVFELFSPLFAGGTSVIVRREEILNLRQLDLTLRHCTALHAVPTLLRQIVQHTVAPYPQIRRVFVGGEAVPPDLLAALAVVFPRARITVLYGPTEATIICMHYPVPRDVAVMGYPIGQPLPNYQVRLYDAHRQLVPVGVAGELYIGGVGVTRGYLDRPDLTAEKYIELDGTRWYRTGDLVRWRADGTVEFLGRIDQQVKIRGFRIELGEIEALLTQHPAVREAVVVRDNHAGDPRLVAYVVPNQEPGTENSTAIESGSLSPVLGSPQQLREFLGQRLPDYMVPSAFVVLDALPLTPMGKIDRKALPAPELSQAASEAAFVPPRTALEEQIASVWSAVLGVERVGVHDNFFALGGHSLLATQVITRVQQLIGQEVPLRLLFEAPTVAAFAAHLGDEPIDERDSERVISTLAADRPQPDRALPAARAAATDDPHERCVHDLFSVQADRTPEAIALAYGDERLTYAALNARANQLARYLQTLGVGPEVLVGICLDRSINLVIGLLAILKAGGAYVPLDPSYPAERLSFMLQDTQTPVVLTAERFRSMLPAHAGRTLCLDSEWPIVAQQPEIAPPSAATADNLAYVMYTSGSTGTPKGVGISHRGITRLVCKTDYAQLTSSDRVAQASNTAFDAATFEIWGALLNGARVVGVARETALAPDQFAALLRAEQITTAFMTTAWFNQVSSLLPDAFQSLRHLLFGGEACDPQRVREVLQHGAPERLLHVYGPTESTTFASWHLVSAVPADASTVPIGMPIANTQIYLLDRQLQIVPPGEPGELYIGGAGLARGYHNRPDVTAEKFVPDPLGTTPGGRLYRTGDLARYREDGAIEFVGRIDHQIKLRGFRVELGEIEAVLRQHEAVREALVLLREDMSPAGGHAQKRLVAYVVERRNKAADSEHPGSLFGESSGPLCSPQDLRAFLGQRLPDYMVPSAFVVLDALPLTPNGKVDRRALPAPDRSDAVEQEGFVAPRTVTEALIAAVWTEVLGISPIGAHDNFFALGGHSLLATQIATRLSERTGRDVPLRLLFEAPTVAAFAARLGGQQATAALPLTPTPRDGTPLPLSFAQQRLWFLDQLTPGSSAHNLPLLLRLRGPLDRAALQHSLTTLVARHEVLRTTFVAGAAEQPVQVIAEAHDIALPLIGVPALAGMAPSDVLLALVRAEAERPFDLRQGPLLRATLFQTTPADHTLVLVFHHSISDGWSESILLRELAACYTAFVADQPVALPELPIQYADYAVWQRQWLQGGILEQQLGYWRRQLRGVAALDLPTDSPRPPVWSGRGASVAV
ncbi:MAG TPA: amino acid adenylation domain-containing protein, partial [Herpetosiphonaceae bacterium]